MKVVINPLLREDDVYLVDGCIEAGSMSAVLAQVERERRRADVLAVWPPIFPPRRWPLFNMGAV